MKNKYLTHALVAIIFAILLITSFGSVATAGSASNLEITDLSGASHEFTFAQLLAMPKTEVNADLYCYGALVTNGNWGGVSLSYLLAQANANAPEVGSVGFVASDGYQVTIPVELARQSEIIIAYEKDAEPLSEGLRLVLPGANGASWISMITSITVSTSGAVYPEGVGAGAGGLKPNGAVPTQNSTTLPSPTEQPTPVQTQPSTPEPSLSVQKATPTNVTQPVQPSTNPVASNVSLNLQTILYVVGFVCAISLSGAAYVSLRHKRKHL